MAPPLRPFLGPALALTYACASSTSASGNGSSTSQPTSSAAPPGTDIPWELYKSPYPCAVDIYRVPHRTGVTITDAGALAHSFAPSHPEAPKPHCDPVQAAATVDFSKKRAFFVTIPESNLGHDASPTRVFRSGGEIIVEVVRPIQCGGAEPDLGAIKILLRAGTEPIRLHDTVQGQCNYGNEDPPP
jgi:hypothetical protein